MLKSYFPISFPIYLMNLRSVFLVYMLIHHITVSKNSCMRILINDIFICKQIIEKINYALENKWHITTEKCGLKNSNFNTKSILIIPYGNIYFSNDLFTYCNTKIWMVRTRVHLFFETVIYTFFFYIRTNHRGT